MKTKWNNYISFTDYYANKVRKELELPGKSEKDSKLQILALKRIFAQGNGKLPHYVFDTLILEHESKIKPFKIFFPESSNLLHMLWNAKLSVSIDDLKSCPQMFMISFPEDFTVNGIKPVGCFVDFRSEIQQIEHLKNFTSFLFPEDAGNLDCIKNKLPETIKRLEEENKLNKSPIRIAWNITDKSFITHHSSYVPEERINEILNSYKVAQYKIDDKIYYDETISVITQLVLRLMVYIAACPESIKDGYPTQDSEIKINKKNWDNVQSFVLSDQKDNQFDFNKISKSHASPQEHVRQAHFRRYPLKEDGTRKEGILFVKACIVNMEKTRDPKTVIDVISKEL